jgi:large subunit ribosomal protein L9
MEVILLTDVPHVGRLGELKRVTPGFARNYLFPKRLAALSTPDTKRLFQRQLEKKRALLESQRQDAAGQAERLKDLQVQIPWASGEGGRLFGSITARQIAEHLKTQGFVLDKKSIVIGDPIRTIGTHRVTLKLHPETQTEISVVVVPQNT